MIVQYLRKAPAIYQGILLRINDLEAPQRPDLKPNTATIAVPGRLYAVLLLDDSHEDGLRLGWSLCCKRDDFSRKAGRALAEARLASWDGEPKLFHKVAATLRNPIHGLLERWVEAKVAAGWPASAAESQANSLLFGRLRFTRGVK